MKQDNVKALTCDKCGYDYCSWFTALEKSTTSHVGNHYTRTKEEMFNTFFSEVLKYWRCDSPCCNFVERLRENNRDKYILLSLV